MTYKAKAEWLQEQFDTWLNNEALMAQRIQGLVRVASDIERVRNEREHFRRMVQELSRELRLTRAALTRLKKKGGVK